MVKNEGGNEMYWIGKECVVCFEKMYPPRPLSPHNDPHVYRETQWVSLVNSPPGT